MKKEQLMKELMGKMGMNLAKAMVESTSKPDGYMEGWLDGSNAMLGLIQSLMEDAIDMNGDAAKQIGGEFN